MICFDSLQTGKHRQTLSAQLAQACRSQGFNSLQTGRHIQTNAEKGILRSGDSMVSIPFKREGTFRLLSMCVLATIVTNGFNSLQTGRHIQTFKSTDSTSPYAGRFQFPSNGKAHSDTVRVSDDNFQEGFNSLQTGRHIQTYEKKICFVRNFGSGFQFPSNGKAHSDCLRVWRWMRKSESFNSLQTGRHIQTNKTLNSAFNLPIDCFNSLQTGRHIQTVVASLQTLKNIKFQFPSNGKAHSDPDAELEKGGMQ